MPYGVAICECINPKLRVKFHLVHVRSGDLELTVWAQARVRVAAGP